MEPVQPNIQTPPPPTEKISAVLIIAALILTGVYFVLNGAYQKFYPKPSPLPSPPTQETVTREASPSAQINSGLTVTVGVAIESTESGKIKGKISATNPSSQGLADLYFNVSLNSQIIKKTGVNTTTVQGPIITYTQSKDSFQLNSKETKTLPFEMEYSPHIPPGEYILMATVVTNLGEPLGTAPPNKVRLSGADDLITFDESTCKVIVSSKEYPTYMASLTEKGGLAEGKCQFTNTSSKPLSLKYSIKYAILHVLSYPKSEKLIQTSTQEVAFAPNETKEVSFKLPSDLEPQVYEAYITFIDKEGQPQSPVSTFRWTIKGESGRVGKISLDKDYYSKGQVAKLTTTVAPSQDLFWGRIGTKLENPKLLVSLSNDKNELCGQTTYSVTDEFTNSLDFTIDVTITKDCLNPSAQVKILSSDKEVANGNTKVLTSAQTLETLKRPQPPLSPYLLAIPAALIILLIIWFIKRKRGGVPTTPISILLILFTFISLLFYLGDKNNVYAGLGINTANSQIRNPLYINLGYNAPGTDRFCDEGKFCAQLHSDLNASVSWSGNTATVTFWGSMTTDSFTCNNASAQLRIEGPGIPDWLGTTSLSSGGWSAAVTYNSPTGPIPLTYNFVLWGQTDTGLRSDVQNCQLNDCGYADPFRNQYGTVTLGLPSGSISASPNPCLIANGGANSTTCNSNITWSTSNYGNVNVYVDRSNTSACTGTLFGSAASFTQGAPWIDTGGHYFHLCSSTREIQRTFVYGVPPPSGLTASCPSPGTSATLSWNSSAGATRYAVRANNPSNPWNNLCDGGQNPGDICEYVTSTSKTFSSTAGLTYSWWVHACTASDCGTLTLGTNFTCTAPTPPTVSKTITCAGAACTGFAASDTTGRLGAESGAGYFNPINITVTASGGSGTYTNYYAALYTGTTLTDPNTFLASAQSRVGTPGANGFLLRYDGSTHYVWVSNAWQNLPWDIYNGVENIGQIVSNGVRSWRVLFHSGYGSKTMHTTVMVEDGNGTKAISQ